MPTLDIPTTNTPLLSSVDTLQGSSDTRTETPESHQEEVPEHWLGWAELENDPAIFSTLLKEWGVPSVEVQEIIELDDLLTNNPDQVCGLILLSRWNAPGGYDGTIEIPNALWFANQVSSYSCASVAIMNIINNRPDLDLGPTLNAFRKQTQDMSPKDRGVALDSFDFIRNVHNSFATEIDKLQVEHSLRDDVAVWERKIKAAEHAVNGNRRKRRRVTMDRKRKRIADDASDYESESGFHFIAYAPCNGSLWKMDGLETTPSKLDGGGSGGDESWLFAAASDLQNQMQAALASNFEFSLMSLVKRSTGVENREDAEDMHRIREDWGPFIAHMVNLHANRGYIRDLMT